MKDAGGRDTPEPAGAGGPAPLYGPPIVVPVPWSDALWPGFGHVRRGAGRRAIKFFLLEILWIGIVVWRTDRVVECLHFGDLDAALAVVSLLLLPPILVVWARADLRAFLNPASKIEGASPRRIAFERLLKNTRAVAGMWCLVALYLVALLRPVLTPYDPSRQPRDGIVNSLRGPGTTVTVFAEEGGRELYTMGWKIDGETLVLQRDPAQPDIDKRIAIEKLGRPKRGWSLPGERTTRMNGRDVPYREEFHPLGTDESGRDLLSRIIYGSGVSLWIGFIAMAIAVTIGAVVGSVAGYFGGSTDTVLMRLVDILLAFPLLLLLLLLITVFRTPSIWLVVAVLGFTGWMGVARLVRGQFLTLKELDFTVAARALGVPPRRVMFRHLLPNAMAPVIVDATLRVGNTILTEAALSYLGYGVQPPHPSWGNIVNGGSSYLHDAWWIATIPGIAIVFTVAAFNLVGDALRDALDPRLKV